MKLRIDRKHMSQPEGGWGYICENGPVLNGDKLDDLISKIKEHRKINGLPAGDPEDDVARKYSSRFPWLIYQVTDKEEEDNAAESWIHWLWRSFPMQMSEPRVREERFEQCTKCIHFEKLNADDLTDEAARRLLLMNPQKYRTEHGWCTLRGWIPSVAVQIQDPWKFSEWGKRKEECWLDCPTILDDKKS